jgi:hypothetical protein
MGELPGRVQAHAALAARHAQQAAVVHAVQQLRAGVAVAAEPVRAVPWSKAASTSRGCTTPRARTKSSTACACAQRARGHSVRAGAGASALCGARQDAVVDEEVLLDAQRA